MKQNQFSDIRSLLGTLRTVLSGRGVVGAAWDGNTLKLMHAIPETGKSMMVMTFDDPMSDYTADGNQLILEFMKRSAAHFRSRSEENAA